MYVGVAVGYRAWKINESGDLTSPMVVETGTMQSQTRGLPTALVSPPAHARFRPWPKGRIEAECLELPTRKQEDWCEAHTHGPQDGCTCGIYCFSRIVDVLHEFDNGPSCVIGVVALWGKIIVHELGARAQYARPICFADSWVGPVRWTNVSRPLGWEKRKELCVESYGVPEVRLAELEDIALSVGAPLNEFG